MDRHWIDNIADLISGRYHNTLVSLHNRLKTQENKMTQNEQTILNAAQAINNFKTQLDEGITRLEERIEELGVREDLSEELEALNTAISGVGETAGRLTPAPAGTPAGGGSTDAENDTPSASPIDHSANPVVTPLAGSSGPTDAGVPTEVVQPGVTPAEEVPTTPVPEDAQVEANPNLPASETTVPVVEEAPAASDEDDEEVDPNAQFEDDEDDDPDAEVDADVVEDDEDED